MTRISMLQDGSWYTLKVRGVYTQPVDKETALARVEGKHTAFANDEDIPVIVEAMQAWGWTVKSRTH